MAKTDLTAQRLREILHYDPDTGEFTWLVPVSQRIRAGARAGTHAKGGYRRITLGGYQYLAHRLAWLHVHGTLPVHLIDHIDGITSNNRISNLRCVTSFGNQQNQRFAHSNSSSGFLGVGRRHGKWFAQISSNGMKMHIGMFDTPEAAHAAYLETKRKLHETCAI